jgi:hypothetical protein
MKMGRRLSGSCRTGGPFDRNESHAIYGQDTSDKTS